ncbi:hypothetical protein U9M48_008162 [Paspalum notatum var. saurae]|uniref:Uncharacterized protein n=1 Tax=Paspalum notatum var. saurae TaxID=547442 RepID=A0AAQ3WCX8_PASNO
MPEPPATARGSSTSLPLPALGSGESRSRHHQGAPLRALLGVRTRSLWGVVRHTDRECGQLVEACFPPNALTAPGGCLDRLVAFSPTAPLSMTRSSPCAPGPVLPAMRLLYGFVFNLQRLDERLPRGGEQNSAVILPHAPYSSLFRLLLQILGPLCFHVGPSATRHPLLLLLLLLLLFFSPTAPRKAVPMAASPMAASLLCSPHPAIRQIGGGTEGTCYMLEIKTGDFSSLSDEIQFCLPTLVWGFFCAILPGGASDE